MKPHVQDQFCHAFWGKMECGLVLSSVSAWEVVQKKTVEATSASGAGFWSSTRRTSEPPPHLGRAAIKGV